MKSRLLSSGLTLTCVALFVVTAHLALTSWSDTQKSSLMQGFSDAALSRATSTVDFAVRTLNDVAAGDPMDCEPGALQRLRLRVYQTGSIKDIRLARWDGAVLCSAYSETLEFDQSWQGRDDMRVAAGAPDIRLFRVNQFSSTALGVMKDVDATNALIAIVGISTYLLDVLPPELRDHSDVALELDPSEVIARRAPADDRRIEQGMTFVRASDEYPLRIVIRVDEAAFAAWNRGPYHQTLAAAGILGALFGALISASLFRGSGMKAEIDAALAAGEFIPYYQPIFNMRTGRIVGCEALARWKRPDGTLVSPVRFLPMVESMGRIDAMTWRIMATALVTLQPILKHDKSFKITFNIDPNHFLADDFVSTARGLVSGAAVATRQIVFEITERHEFQDIAGAIRTIEELRDYGFRIAIDDVGIGHNGLRHIQQLGANTLKIDKFFVDLIDRDPTANAVINMLVRLGRELKVGLVAEGIETEEQLAALNRCGVEEGQGYLVSPPLPGEEFVAFVKANVAADELAEIADRRVA